MALPTSLRLWNTSVLSSAYSMMSFSWWWKNSRIPGGRRQLVSGKLSLLGRDYGKCWEVLWEEVWEGVWEGLWEAAVPGLSGKAENQTHASPYLGQG